MSYDIHRGNFTGNAWDSYLWYQFWKLIIQGPHLPRVNELTTMVLPCWSVVGGAWRTHLLAFCLIEIVIWWKMSVHHLKVFWIVYFFKWRHLQHGGKIKNMMGNIIINQGFLRTLRNDHKRASLDASYNQQNSPIIVSEDNSNIYIYIY